MGETSLSLVGAWFIEWVGMRPGDGAPHSMDHILPAVGMGVNWRFLIFDF
jgi:hypothetical protein